MVVVSVTPILGPLPGSEDSWSLFGKREDEGVQWETTVGRYGGVLRFSSFVSCYFLWYKRVVRDESMEMVGQGLTLPLELDDFLE